MKPIFEGGYPAKLVEVTEETFTLITTHNGEENRVTFFGVDEFNFANLKKAEGRQVSVSFKIEPVHGNVKAG